MLIFELILLTILCILWYIGEILLVEVKQDGR